MLLSVETRMGLQMAGNGTISHYIFTSLNSYFFIVHSFIGIVKYVRKDCVE